MRFDFDFFMGRLDFMPLSSVLVYITESLKNDRG